MKRTVLLFLAGCASGAAATFVFMVPHAPVVATVASFAAESDGSLFGAGSVDATASAVGGWDAPPPTQQRIALYAEAAAADADTLRASIAASAELPASAARRFALEVLLTRYAEIDARGAALFAQQLDLDATLLTPLYQAWAAVDAPGALRGLRAVVDRQAARKIALALVDVLGEEERAVARLLEALPDVDAARFQAEVITGRAADRPDTALLQALRLPDSSARHFAVREIAAQWARTDPHAALSARDRISDPQLLSAFDENVLREWALFEPLAVLDHLAERGEAQMFAAGGFTAPAIMIGGALLSEIARADPERVLELANRLPQPLRQIAPQIALRAWAEDEPLRALAFAEAAPPGALRQQYLQAVATAYGSADPDAALEWAQSHEMRNPGVVAATLSGIAGTDLERAMDVALAEPDRIRRMQAAQSIFMGMGPGLGMQAERVADRLLADLDGNAEPEMLQWLTSVWASQDAQTAVEWLLAHADRIGAESFRQVGQQLSFRDPTLAASYTPRVPEEARPAWIASVAQGYAQTAPQEAMQWIARFRGEPGFEDAALAVVQVTAQHDPHGAAGLLDSIDSSGPNAAMTAAAVAHHLATQDPYAAGEWARRLSNEQARAQALRNVAIQWAAQDRYAARSFALGLARGTERDAVLGVLLGTIGILNDESIDPSLLDAFSSSVAGERALLPIIAQRGQRDRAAGQALIDAHLTDPGLRQQAEQMMTANREGGLRMMSSPGIAMGPNGAFFVPRTPPPR